MAQVNKVDAERAPVAQRFYSAPLVIAVGAGSNVSHPTALQPGQYRACSNVKAYVLQAANNAQTITTANAHPLVANLPEAINVTGDSDDYLNVFCEAAGSVWLSRR